MNINLEDGTFIEIGGEVGKYNSLPIDYLIQFAISFQELVLDLANIDLPAVNPINPASFNIELIDFKKGSAVPKFAFSQRSEFKTGKDWQLNRKTVGEKAIRP